MVEMKKLVILFLISAFSNAAIAEMGLHIGLSPSFHPGLNIYVSSSGKVEIKYSTSYQSEKMKFVELIELKRAEQILISTRDILKTPDHEDKRIGLDGIKVNIRFIEGSEEITKNSWSPSPLYSRSSFQVVQLAYELMGSLNAPILLQNHIEQLESYFELGLPVKIKKGNPYNIRFYAGLSANDKQELSNVLRSIPDGVEVVVDMSNFNGMGTVLYPEFREFLSRNLNISWIASGRAKYQLIEIGVSEVQIMPNNGG